jgi:hypothetical protein
VKKFTGGSLEFLKPKVALSPGYLSLGASDMNSAVVARVSKDTLLDPTGFVCHTTKPQSLLVLDMKDARNTFSIGSIGIPTTLS